MSHLSKLHYALGQPASSAIIRQQPEDFQVNEQLSFGLSGDGQHVFLLIEKSDLNTVDVAAVLSKFSSVKPVAVGYAGLKDKHALTRQWFSVDMAGKTEPDWVELNADQLQVLEVTRHGRKLKRGAIRSNHFQISLRNFNGDQNELITRLEYIKKHGVPNYFGEQRFGNNDANLRQAEKLLSGEIRHVKRHLRSIYFSAVRSYLFNLVLSQRVTDKTWDQPLRGDVFMLDGSHSVFIVDTIDQDIIRRIAELDIHPTGPMWGNGELMTTADVFALETSILQSHDTWCEFLARAGMNQERRALRMKVVDLEWEFQGDCVVLRFGLPAGCYATSVLRELVSYK